MNPNWNSDELDEDLLDLLCVSEVETITEAYKRLEGATAARRRMESLDKQQQAKQPPKNAVDNTAFNQPKHVSRENDACLGGQNRVTGHGRGRLYSSDGKVNDIGRRIEQQVREVLGDHHQEQVLMKMYHEHHEKGSKVAEERSHKKQESPKMKSKQHSKPSVKKTQSDIPEPVINKNKFIKDWLQKVGSDDHSNGPYSEEYQQAEEAVKPKDLKLEYDRMKKMVSDMDHKRKSFPTRDSATPSIRNYYANKWRPMEDGSTDFKLQDIDFPLLSESSASVNTITEEKTEKKVFEDPHNDYELGAAKAEAAIVKAVIPDPPQQESKLLVIENFPVDVTASNLRECFEEYGNIEKVHLEIAKDFCKVYIRAAEDVLDWIRSCFDNLPGDGIGSTPLKAYFEENI